MDATGWALVCLAGVVMCLISIGLTNLRERNARIVYECNRPDHIHYTSFDAAECRNLHG